MSYGGTCLTEEHIGKGMSYMRACLVEEHVWEDMSFEDMYYRMTCLTDRHHTGDMRTCPIR